jgi:outer membrane protein assembly factor BamB
VEPEHLLIGICSLDNAQWGAQEKLLDPVDRAAVDSEKDEVNSIFRDVWLDSLPFAAAVRRKLGKGAGQKIDGEVHDSPELMSVLQHATVYASPGHEIACVHLLVAILERFSPVVVSVLQVAQVSSEVLLKRALELVTMHALRGDHRQEWADAQKEPAAPKETSPSREKTPYLDRYGRDLTKEASQNEPGPFVGRRKEPRQMIQTPTWQSKNNPVPAGDAGLGRTAIQEATPAMWPMVGYDSAHTGQCPHSTLHNAGGLRWRCRVYNGFCPVIGLDGVVYVEQGEGDVCAYSPQGSFLWSSGTYESVERPYSPAIGPDGTVYHGWPRGGIRAAAPADGRQLWSRKGKHFRTGDWPRRYGWLPTVGPDGTIYALSDNGYLHAFAPAGKEEWAAKVFMARNESQWRHRRAKSSGSAAKHAQERWLDRQLPSWGHWPPMAGSPAVSFEGTVYVGTDDGHLVAVRPDGTILWRLDVGFITNSPSVAADGTVYIGTEEGIVLAICRDSTLKWTYSTGSPILSLCSIGNDGTIYFGCYDGRLHAVSPGGQRKWSYLTRGPIVSSPALSSEGIIYFGSGDRGLRALDLNGHRIWKFEAQRAIFSSPAISADGTVYVTSEDRYLYALGGN